MATDAINKNPSATVPAGTQESIAAKNAANGKATTKSGEKNAVGQQEFLKLLVTQLQNQDPLNPMDSQEFAVQLAQFSQVEQLVSLNKKFDDVFNTGNSVSSMSQFLGHQVTLRDSGFNIASGKGPNLLLDIPEGTKSLRVDFYNSSNTKVGSEQVDSDLQAGKQIFALDGIKVPDGEYSVRAVAVNSSGSFQDLEAKATGTVEGFVLQPSPALLINGQHVDVDQIAEVLAL